MLLAYLMTVIPTLWSKGGGKIAKGMIEGKRMDDGDSKRA
jgi:hypothetical protein